VFTSLAVFDGVLRLNIRNAMNNIPVIIQGTPEFSGHCESLPHSILGKVSLDRVNEFLRTVSIEHCLGRIPY
jgi:hypothetical protein